MCYFILKPAPTRGSDGNNYIVEYVNVCYVLGSFLYHNSLSDAQLSYVGSCTVYHVVTVKKINSIAARISRYTL